MRTYLVQADGLYGYIVVRREHGRMVDTKEYRGGNLAKAERIANQLNQQAAIKRPF